VTSSRSTDILSRLILGTDDGQTVYDVISHVPPVPSYKWTDQVVISHVTVEILVVRTPARGHTNSPNFPTGHGDHHPACDGSRSFYSRNPAPRKFDYVSMNQCGSPQDVSILGSRSLQSPFVHQQETQAHYTVLYMK
jgi:hypothetical protein